MGAALTSSVGFIAPEAEREKGAVTAATQDRDLECPFFSGGPALPVAPAASSAGASPTSRECAREVAAEERELSTVKLWLAAGSSSLACSACAGLPALAPLRRSSIQHSLAQIQLASAMYSNMRTLDHDCPKGSSSGARVRRESL